jgi:hypothetical protein
MIRTSGSFSVSVPDQLALQTQLRFRTFVQAVAGEYGGDGPVQLEGHRGYPGVREGGALLRHPASQHQPADPCTTLSSSAPHGLCRRPHRHRRSCLSSLRICTRNNRAFRAEFGAKGGVTEAAVLHLRSLVARLRLANTEFHQAEQKLDELCARLSQDVTAAAHGPGDAAILRSLPGVGLVVLATLLTEAGDPLARRDYAALRTLSGVAPVTKRSGKTCIVVMRYAAQDRLRQAMFHWARVAAVHDPKSRSRYEALRARGHSYGRALRGVADRLLGVACALLRQQVLFDPDHAKPTAA